jgi:hypothetical protein
MNFIGPVHSASMFTWNNEGGCIEASDFGNEVWMSQLFPDSCDVGFRVRSEKTGKVIPFTLERVEKRESEIVAWHFVSYSRERYPLEIWKIVVFND